MADEDPITGVDLDDAYRPHQRIRGYQVLKLVCIAVLVGALLLLDGVARIAVAGLAAFVLLCAFSAVGGALLDLEREEKARRRGYHVDDF